jgi:hypothetical protein
VSKYLNSGEDENDDTLRIINIREDEEGDLRIINIRDITIKDEESRSNNSFEPDSPISDPPSTPNHETKLVPQPQPKHKADQASRK